jgi:hypothetical protein
VCALREDEFEVELLAMLWMNEVYDRREDYELFHAEVETL